MFTTTQANDSPDAINEYWTPERMAATQAPATQLGAAMPVQNPNAPPYRCVGKLFYRNRGVDYVASACVVNRRGLLTAAHCLYDPRTLTASDSLLFIPAYSNATQPFGTWGYTATFLRYEWRDSPNYAYNVGCVMLQAGGNGPRPQQIGDAVGVLPVVTNTTSTSQIYNEVGYPVNYANAAVMYEEQGSYQTSPTAGTFGKTGTFSAGASGSPFLIDNGSPTGAVNGIHGFLLDSNPGVVYSAVFADWVAQLINGAFPP